MFFSLSPLSFFRIKAIIPESRLTNNLLCWFKIQLSWNAASWHTSCQLLPLLFRQKLISNLMYENERKLPWRGNLIYLKERFGRIKRKKIEKRVCKQKDKENENGKIEKVLEVFAVVGTGFKITRTKSVACKSR
jgi:hypothetical protein